MVTPDERITRGKQAEVALDQFLAPAFDHVIAAYHARLIDIAAEAVTEDDKRRIVKLATAIKIARNVQEQIVAIVRDGDAALLDKRKADHIAAMPEEKRRWALMGGGY